MEIEIKIELLEKSKEQLEKLTEELRRRGYILAKIENEYRQALAKKELELREQKLPANLVYDIARGQLAELRYKRDIAEIEVEVLKEKLRTEKQGADNLRSLIAWDKATYLNS